MTGVQTCALPISWRDRGLCLIGGDDGGAGFGRVVGQQHQVEVAGGDLPLADWGAIEEEDLNLLCRVDSTDEAFDELTKHLLAHHMVPETTQETKAPGIAKTLG